ncbi:MAG: Uma2 family endonuclease [Syntrophobacteraceae bacterium]
MEWREVVEHPSLKDLPFKIETNEWGKIVMTPATGAHAGYQALIVEWFAKLKGKNSRTFAECPIQTTKGVRVADVAWASETFIKKHGSHVLVFAQAPDIVVEVESPSNSFQEMEEKKSLYFEAGAKEVWICDEQGHMKYFNPRGKLEESVLFGDFPEHIEF